MFIQSEPEGVDELQDVKDIEGDDTTDWKAEHQKLVEKAIKSRERTRMLREENKALKAKQDELAKSQVQPPTKQEPHSNEPDYSRLAYLEAKQINHPDDQKIVMEEANRLKLPLTDVLQMEHIKARLAENSNQRISQDGMPKGQGRKGGESKNSVEYYLAHPDEVPEDLELHNKVIDAKMKKEKDSNMFSSTPFVG